MDEEVDTVDLADILAGLLVAITRARHLGDLEAARLAKLYADEQALAGFLAPRFEISTVDVTLRFAVQGPSAPEDGLEGSPSLLVSISPQTLQRLEPHQITEMTLSVTSSPVRLVGPEERPA